MPILQDFELSLDADDVVRAQGGDPEVIRARRPTLVQVAERALAEGTPLLRPVVLYREFPVRSLTHERLLLKGGALSGPLVGQRLALASRVVVAVCTVGPGVENRAIEAIGHDLQYGLALDGVGSAAVEVLAAAACHQFERQAEADGLSTTARISPGMVGWPVSDGQRQIFSLLSPGEIGVSLLSSGMMHPRKSLSLVIGHGVGAPDNSEPCDHCSMRETCRYRSH